MRIASLLGVVVVALLVGLSHSSYAVPYKPSKNLWKMNLHRHKEDIDVWRKFGVFRSFQVKHLEEFPDSLPGWQSLKKAELNNDYPQIFSGDWTRITVSGHTQTSANAEVFNKKPQWIPLVAQLLKSEHPLSADDLATLEAGGVWDIQAAVALQLKRAQEAFDDNVEDREAENDLKKWKHASEILGVFKMPFKLEKCVASSSLGKNLLNVGLTAATAMSYGESGAKAELEKAFHRSLRGSAPLRFVLIWIPPSTVFSTTSPKLNLYKDCKAVMSDAFLLETPHPVAAYGVIVELPEGFRRQMQEVEVDVFDLD